MSPLWNATSRWMNGQGERGKKKEEEKKKKEKKSYQPPPNYQWSRGDPSPSTTVIYHSTTFRKRFRARHSLDYFKHTRGTRVHEMRELAELRPVPEQSIDLSTRLFAGNAARINRRVHIIFEKSIDRERGRLVGNGFRKFIFQFFSWFFFSLSLEEQKHGPQKWYRMERIESNFCWSFKCFQLLFEIIIYALIVIYNIL